MYPIKGCKGISVQEADIGIQGMAFDRKLMIVEKSTGMFVAQRGDKGAGIGIRSLCQIEVTISHYDKGYYLKVSAPGMRTMRIFPAIFPRLKSWRKSVQIWGQAHKAVEAEREENEWFTKFISRERPGTYQLVIMHDDYVRRTKHGFSQLQFADAYPFLVTSQESLDDLNGRIGSNEPLPMDRFRPNIILTGGKPYEEDRLDRMAINDVDMEGMKLCVRCPVTMTNQETLEMGKEPLKTLATYRRNPVAGKSGVVFGRYFNHLSNGTIKVGDEVKIHTYQEAGPWDN